MCDLPVYIGIGTFQLSDVFKMVLPWFKNNPWSIALLQSNNIYVRHKDNAIMSRCCQIWLFYLTKSLAASLAGFEG